MDHGTPAGVHVQGAGASTFAHRAGWPERPAPYDDSSSSSRVGRSPAPQRKKVASRSTYTRRRRACWACAARPLRACGCLPTPPAPLPLLLFFRSQRRPFHSMHPAPVSSLTPGASTSLLALRGQGCPAYPPWRAQPISRVTSSPTTPLGWLIVQNNAMRSSQYS